MKDLQKYRLSCTLTFGDIYGQIVVWLLIIFASLASALAAMAGSSQPLYALATVALVLVVTLPFLLFSFVTTLLNHIEATPAEAKATQAASTTSSVTSSPASAGI